MLENITCPCCSAPLNDLNESCTHCGTHFRESNGGISANKNEACPQCKSKYYEGQEVCLDCHTIISPSRKLNKKINKVCFSQDKYRSSFIPEVQDAFNANEYVLADTYGPTEYFIVTTEKLIICEIKTRVFTGKTTLCGPKSTVPFENITKLTSWSDVWYQNNSPLTDPPLMSLQIETFHDDINMDVFVLQANGGLLGKPHFFKDPKYFGAALHQAFHTHEEEKSFYDHILYTIGTKSVRSSDTDSDETNHHPVITEPLPIQETYRVRCTCGANLKIKAEALGKNGVCPKCQRKFRISLP